MGKKSVFMIIIIAMLMTLALSFVFTDFSGNITGMVVDETYLEDLEVSECIKTGNWDQENSNYKLTKCPSNLLMKGVGIAVTKDALSGGRAYCCDAGLEYYDCEEGGNWEKRLEDYRITFCPDDRPFLTGVGINVLGGQQAGGKAMCCKARDVELYNCAVGSYWKGTNENHRLTVCPEDRPVMSGVGFSVKENYQYGGKAYCCGARVKVSDTRVVEKVDDEIEITDVEDEPLETVTKDEEETELVLEEGGVCKVAKKIFC